jgi:hypothetical protein
MDDVFPVNITMSIRNADIIVVGDLQRESSVSENIGKAYYRIHATKIIKGDFSPERFLCITIDQNHQLGTPPIIEPDMPFMLFLKKNGMEINAPSSTPFYMLSNNWMDLIALTTESKEHRSVDLLFKKYGVDVRKDPSGFIKAVSMALTKDAFMMTKQALGIFSIFDVKAFSVIDKSDVVVVAKIKKVGAPYEVLGRWFYKIEVQETIKGKLDTDHFLEIIYNRDSSWGRAPDPESDMLFLFCLKATHPDGDAPKNYTYYQLIDYWKGIVSFNKTSQEQRAVNELIKTYGIDVRKMPLSFIESVRFFLDKNVKKEAENAIFFYDALKLNNE